MPEKVQKFTIIKLVVLQLKFLNCILLYPPEVSGGYFGLAFAQPQDIFIGGQLLWEGN